MKLLARTGARARLALAVAAAGMAALFACAAASGCSDSNGAEPTMTSGDGGADAENVDAAAADASTDAPSDGATRGDATDGGTVARKSVFVSKAKSNGTMTFGGLFVGGGRASADKLCNMEAKAIGFAGTFVAYLSTLNEPAPARLPDNAAWYLTSTPVLVFPSRAAIPGGPQNPIDREANGAFASGATVWTGTEQSGVRAANFCNDWSEGTTAAAGRFGRTDGVGFWTAQNDDTCDRELRIYCFEK